MPIKQVLTDQRVPVKIWTDDVDENSKKQLTNIASMPFIHHHVAAMPDVHLGIGATIGSVIATHKAIIPAAVGVDIGCGMVACRLSITANDLDEKSLKGVFEQMSRTAAEKQFTEADLARQTDGVICRKDSGVIDEIPGAYKDIDAVMENQKDLTETLHTLKQLVCVKG